MMAILWIFIALNKPLLKLVSSPKISTGFQIISKQKDPTERIVLLLHSYALDVTRNAVQIGLFAQQLLFGAQDVLARFHVISNHAMTCINSKSNSQFNHYDHSLPARFLNTTSTAVYLYRGQLLVVLVACDRRLGNASVKATTARQDGAMLPIDGGGLASSLPSIPHAGRPSSKPRDSSARRPPPPPQVVLSLVRSTRRAPSTLRGSRRRRRRASRRPRGASSAHAYARGAALRSKETGERTGPSRRLGRSPQDMHRTSARRGARTLRRVQLRTRSRTQRILAHACGRTVARTGTCTAHIGGGGGGAVGGGKFGGQGDLDTGGGGGGCGGAGEVGGGEGRGRRAGGGGGGGGGRTGVRRRRICEFTYTELAIRQYHIEKEEAQYYEVSPNGHSSFQVTRNLSAAVSTLLINISSAGTF